MNDPHDMARHRPDPGPDPDSRPADALSRQDKPAEPAMDISPVLAGWEYEGGTINVRKVAGLDGREKLQMRLDLGLLQMELTGRPDGRRPHDRDSLLEYHEHRLAEYRKAHSGSSDGFTLASAACRQLRDEAVLFYHRYLGLFVLGEYEGVVRDTARNLRVLDLCAEHAAEDHDRLILEQYRPYILMMNARASGILQLRAGRLVEALAIVDAGLLKIREFFAKFGQDDAYAKSSEVRILKRLARQIRRAQPVDPVRRLQGKLDRAVRREDYEEAARLRDEIKVRKTRQEQG